MQSWLRINQAGPPRAAHSVCPARLNKKIHKRPTQGITQEDMRKQNGLSIQTCRWLSSREILCIWRKRCGSKKKKKHCAVAFCRDATLLSLLWRTCRPQPCSVEVDGPAMLVAQRRKHTADLEVKKNAGLFQRRPNTGPRPGPWG